MGRIVVCSSALLFTACAAFKKAPDPLNDPTSSKCYVVEATDGVSEGAYEALFRDIPTNGREFAACDNGTDAQVRVRPVESITPKSHWPSYFSLGFDLTTAGAGIGLTALTANPFPMMIAGIQMTPTSRITYSIEHADTTIPKKPRVIIVEDPAWFQDSAAAYSDLLERSSRELSAELFNVKHPLEQRKLGRAGVKIYPLIFGAREGDLVLGGQIEQFLPGNMSWVISGFMAPEHGVFEDSFYSIQGGVRRFALGDHARFFLGLEALFAMERQTFILPPERLRVFTTGALVTGGYVWQGEWIYSELAMGVGPGRAWVEQNDSGIKGGFGTVVSGIFLVGVMF